MLQQECMHSTYAVWPTLPGTMAACIAAHCSQMYFLHICKCTYVSYIAMSGTTHLLCSAMLEWLACCAFTSACTDELIKLSQDVPAHTMLWCLSKLYQHIHT